MNVSSQPQSIEALVERIAPFRAQLAIHPLYASIQTLGHVRIFMESHVFAVWDFMCLLKSLQRALTCVDTLWIPTAHATSRRFINEIVLGEESDEYEGRALSHFEVYLESMQQAGADISVIAAIIESIRTDARTFDDCLDKAPTAAQKFVRETLRLIRDGSLPAQAAAFTFGREDVIPEMFRSLVRDLNRERDGRLRQFAWYLDRHIEVDGDDHGPLSLRMIADLCGNDSRMWEEAAQSAESALRSRIGLWDSILHQIRHGS